MKNLNTLDDDEIRRFFDSFDCVLCDVHGVLLNVLGDIPGAADGVKSLQGLGKRFIVVSNNTTSTLPDFQKELKKSGFDVEEKNIVTPILTTISYLKKQKFEKEIFVLGSKAFRNAIEEANIKVAKRGPMEIEETLLSLATASTKPDHHVGAVMTDIDVNINYVNIQKAATFLKDPDVMFLQGATERRFSVGANRVIIGPGMFGDLLKEFTGREALSMAKPSAAMNDYIVDKYGLKESSRVLFIGDSIQADMGFATAFGYKKLLVLSGLTQKDAIEKWKDSEEYKPNFYVDSLKSVHELILRVFKQIK